MKIAFMDSGIGGLSVLHYALECLPEEEFVYYADEAHVPYGEKSLETIIGYVDEAVRFLLEQDVKAIVIACNTATSAAISVMRSRHSIPIIGMEPAVKRAVECFGDERVLVTATPMTVRGEKLHNLIETVDRAHMVDLLPLPQLVHFAENEQYNTAQVRAYLSQQLGRFDLSEYGSLVLGCTHFNYFKDTFRDLIPKGMHFVDGIEGTVRHLIHELAEKNLLEHNCQIVSFFNSGIPVTAPEQLERLNRYMARLTEMRKM